MPARLNTTFAVLAKSKNDAALTTLIPALDAPEEVIRNAALGALLDRRSPKAQREILQRMPTFGEAELEVIRQRRGKLSVALRAAVLGDVEDECRHACQAILWFREYDLTPVLVNAAEDQANASRALAATTLRSLCELLYNELSTPRDYNERRDPQLVRRHVVSTLELSLDRFGKHQCREIVESFLLLASRDNVVLKQILSNPHSEAYLAMVDALKHGDQAGILRLLLGLVEDPTAPSAGLAVIAHRCDPRFVELLTKKIGFEPSTSVAANLARIESIPWFECDIVLLDELDDQGQHGAVKLAEHAAVRRSQAYLVISYLLQYGKLGGRRAAARALPKFSGAEANSLALRALTDPDPQVQAIVASQLRGRGIPGAVSHLISLAESPHGVVRAAVRESLSEFTFEHFYNSFDAMDEPAQRSTAALVRKIDPGATRQVAETLVNKSRTKRLRALKVAELLEIVPEVESRIIALLGDSDHVIRREAASALAFSVTDRTVIALRESLLDKSVAVQEAAEESLERIMASDYDAFEATTSQISDTSHEPPTIKEIP